MIMLVTVQANLMARGRDSLHDVRILFDHPPYDEETPSSLLACQFLKDGACAPRQVIRGPLMRHSVRALEVEADKQPPRIISLARFLHDVPPPVMTKGQLQALRCSPSRMNQVRTSRHNPVPYPGNLVRAVAVFNCSSDSGWPVVTLRLVSRRYDQVITCCYQRNTACHANLNGDFEECHPLTERLQVGKAGAESTQAGEGALANLVVDCLFLLVSFVYWWWALYWQRS